MKTKIKPGDVCVVVNDEYVEFDCNVVEVVGYISERRGWLKVRTHPWTMHDWAMFEDDLYKIGELEDEKLGVST